MRNKYPLLSNIVVAVSQATPVIYDHVIGTPSGHKDTFHCIYIFQTETSMFLHLSYLAYLLEPPGFFHFCRASRGKNKRFRLLQNQIIQNSGDKYHLCSRGVYLIRILLYK